MNLELCASSFVVDAVSIDRGYANEVQSSKLEALILRNCECFWLIMNFEIMPMTRDHWQKVREIYLAGIATGQATFETDAPSWDEWNATHLEFARIVAVAQSDVKGWAALSPVSRRLAYKGVAEVTVYVAADCRGLGCGRILLDALISESEKGGIWTLQASIFPENVASIKLHRTYDFREVGYRERVSKLNGIWRNTILFERRSALY
jgi:L-amino acid N-acyltransferase YncA